MTLKRLAYVGGSIFLVLFAASVLFLGNQRLAYADIPTTVFCLLEAEGDPVAVFDVEECEEQDGEVIPDVCPEEGLQVVGPCEDEDDSPVPFQCIDGVDNDEDGLLDMDDPDCESPVDNTESGSMGNGGDEEETDAELCEANGGTWNSEYNEGAGRCEYTLTVTDVGPGVTNLAGVSMHATGSLVTLTPDPKENAVFSGFSQDCTGTEPCVLEMTGNTNVTATYACDAGYHESEGNCVADSSDDDDDQPSGGGSGPAPSGGGGNGPIVGSLGSDGPAVLGTSIAAPVIPIPGGQCSEYLTKFIKLGGDNDSEQVKRLQHVLKNFEGAAIDESGVYDEATHAAVHAFQTKYASEILAPWGISQSTGFVYLTTRKKVNEIYCNQGVAFPLSPAEEAIVSGRAHSQTAAAAAVPAATVSNEISEEELPEVDLPEATDEAATTENAPVDSAWGSVRNFFRNLFDRVR